MTIGQWIVANQTTLTAVVTVLVTAVWTPFIRKLPQTSWVWVLIRAVLAGVPTEPTAKVISEAKPEAKNDPPPTPV